MTRSTKRCLDDAGSAPSGLRPGASWASFLVLVSLLVLQANVAPALTFTFTKIADTSTPVPGGAGSFSSFSEPALDGGDVAFFSFQNGIYKSIGGSLAVVADSNTPIPGGSGNFTGFNDTPSFDNGSVAFRGDGGGFQTGIYTDFGGSLSLVADRNTPIPGGSGNFTHLDSPMLDAGTMVLWGAQLPAPSQGQGDGIYTRAGGSLSVIADWTTPVPGGSGNFNGFDLFPAIEGSMVAFGGVGSVSNGIYTDVSGLLGVAFDNTTAIPGGSGNFTDFAWVALDSGKLAFRGRGSSGQEGIYTDASGSLAVVADLNTPIPGGTGNFTWTGEGPAFDGGSVAFRGLGSGGQDGIYSNLGGSLERVIDVSQSLDGKTPTGFFFGREGLSGNRIAFGAWFDDGSSGIYVAVPEPSTALLLALGLAGLAGMRRRYQNSVEVR